MVETKSGHNGNPDFFNCTDYNGGPPLTEGEKCHIVFKSYGFVPFFDGDVSVGSLYTLAVQGQ